VGHPARAAPPVVPPNGGPQGASTPSCASTVPRRCRPAPFVSGGNIRGLTNRSLSRSGHPRSNAGGQASRRPHSHASGAAVPGFTRARVPWCRFGCRGYPQPGHLPRRGRGALGTQNPGWRSHPGGLNTRCRANSSCYRCSELPPSVRGVAEVPGALTGPPGATPLLPHRRWAGGLETPSITVLLPSRGCPTMSTRPG